jgi:signal transduction histidine kinase
VVDKVQELKQIPMARLHRLWYKMVGPHPTDADEGRREYMSKVSFAMMAIALGVCTLLIVAGCLAGIFDLLPVAVMLAIDLPIGASWWLVHRGHWRLARYVPPVVFLGLGLYGNYGSGLTTTFVIFYAIAILLAGMLLGSRMHWLVLGLAIVGFVTVGWAHDHGPEIERLAPVIPVVGAFVGIALLQRLSANQLQHAVDRLRSNAMELQAEVAERKRAEEELRRTQAELVQSAKMAAFGELAAGVAHELNNPLTPVLGLSELLLRSNSLDEQVRHDLNIVTTEARRARDIVINLLDFAHQIRSNREWTDLNQGVHDTLALFRSQLEANRIRVEEQYAPDLPPVLLDTGRLRQVWLNLFTNASQSMPNGGKLTVRTEQAGDRIAVRIVDTGIGIPTEAQLRIFEPFYTTRPVGQGTGLGLSVSLGIVQEHGGSIDVASQEGKGSTFTVWLPVKKTVALPS